jgi:hypothetical protein
MSPSVEEVRADLHQISIVASPLSQVICFENCGVV